MPKRVLVVDDDFSFRALLSSLIKADGHDVTETDDGVNAIDIIRHQANNGSKGKSPFDLILSDFNMAQMGGYEFITALRREEGMNWVPIIMITATDKDIRELVEMEGVKFLKKLCSNQEILSAIRHALGSSNGSAAPQENSPPPASAFTVESEAAPQIVPQEEAPKPSPEETREEARGAAAHEALRMEAETKRLAMLSSSIAPAKDTEEDGPSTQELSRGSADSQLIQLVNGILAEAIERRASDIHLEPDEHAIFVRLRIDGVLQEVLKLPLQLKHNIAARIKIMSNLNITEKRLPQDGRFSMRLDAGRHVEFRVSTLPAQFGESIVLRLLRHEKIATKLNSIFLRERDLELVQNALKAPTGLILVTGPTGGGKSTTLYAMLETLNNSTRKIVTVEDPVEREIPGIIQVPVKPQIGLDFEKVLRACLRHDPNVLMVGEIRDLETAEIAFKAAMTGHLVLSTLHTNQAHMAVYRLATMGLKPFMITASTRLVIAQRLLRLLCPHCKVKRDLTADEARTLTTEERAMFPETYAAKGCPRCNDTGYMGRTAILEVMSTQSHQMRQLIMECANPDDILRWAQTEGMITLRQAALEVAAKGLTSMAEAFTIYFID